PDADRRYTSHAVALTPAMAPSGPLGAIALTPIRLAPRDVRGPRKQDRQLLAPRPHHVFRAPAQEGPLQGQAGLVGAVLPAWPVHCPMPTLPRPLSLIQRGCVRFLPHPTLGAPIGALLKQDPGSEGLFRGIASPVFAPPMMGTGFQVSQTRRATPDILGPGARLTLGPRVVHRQHVPRQKAAQDLRSLLAPR